ncbi:MAG: c-type cytochrome [Ferruginibacter sp.]|nr:c-type cytochrome [Chitinophagaceae bacterium]
MLHKKKLLAFASLSVFILLGIAAVKPNAQKERNLKILPKDISDAKLDSIMESYNIALGVKCNFCHVPVQNFPDSLNFASDAEPMKEEARKMMRMTIHINKTNFYFDKNEKPEYLHTVTCKTCHRGEPFPPED